MKHFILLAFLAFSSVFFSQNTDSLIPINLKEEIPSKIDLRSKFTEVKDQGYRASCGYFAAISMIENEFRKQGKYMNLSEQYLIYATKQTIEKKMGNQKNEASYIDWDIETALKYGVMQEAHWPYQSSWFDYGYPCHGMNQDQSAPVYCYSENRPPKELYDSKISLKGEIVFCPLNIENILLQLGKNKQSLTFLYPFLLDEYLKVKNHFDWNDSIQNIWYEMGEGNHFMVICGYDLKKQLFYVRNSWGKSWANKGYCTISFYDLLNYSRNDLYGVKLSNQESYDSIKVLKDKDVKSNYCFHKIHFSKNRSLDVKLRANISNLGNHTLVFRSLLVCQSIDSEIKPSDSTIIEVQLNKEDQIKFNDGYVRGGWSYIPNTELNTNKWKNNMKISYSIPKELLYSKSVQDLIDSGKYKFFIQNIVTTYTDKDGSKRLVNEFKEIEL